MLIEALIIGIVAGTVCLIASFVGGFVGIFAGLRIVKGYIPGMIWKALSAKDAKGKSLMDLIWSSIQGRINGLGGGRPRKSEGEQLSGGMQNMLGMLQMLQAFAAMNQQNKKPPTQ